MLRVLVVGVTLLALTACDDDPTPPTPAPPPAPASSSAVNLAAWVESLPAGEPPDVPYAVDMTLHLPGGARVPVDGEGLEIIGATPRGTMLNVEWAGYVWVTRDGRTRVLADSRTHGVQDAAVSPEGRLFARGGEVVDLRDGSVVDEIPETASVLTGWVDGGLVFDDRRNRTYLWQPMREPFLLDDRTWFPNRTDVGLVVKGGCREVVHVYPGTAHVERWGTQCGQPSPITVSPGGEWMVDQDLRLVDAAQEKAWALAGGPVDLEGSNSTYWESRHDVLIALPSGVVRCNALERTCERALSFPAELPVR